VLEVLVIRLRFLVRHFSTQEAVAGLVKLAREEQRLTEEERVQVVLAQQAQQAQLIQVAVVVALVAIRAAQTPSILAAMAALAS
jgi:phage terminase Nu1 subunit (DNA packaging protein)